MIRQVISSTFTTAALFLVGCNASREVAPSVESKQNLRNFCLNPELVELENKLFDYPLLQFLDRLEALRDKDDPSLDEVFIQELVRKRLTPEVFPVLWEKLFKEGPDEAIIAGYSEPGELGLSDDGGRGLRLVLRKAVGKYNLSTILFLDYNPRTKKLEFPNDLYFKKFPNYVPDAMRVLIEYDKDISEKDLLNAAQTLKRERVEQRLVGIPIAAKVSPETKSVIDLEILPTTDSEGFSELDHKGQQMVGLMDFWSCTHCHFGGHAFPEVLAGSNQKQLNLSRYSNRAIDNFINAIGSDSTYALTNADRDKVLEEIRLKLKDPKANLKALLPSDFLKVLEAKSNSVQRKSSVIEMYENTN